MSVKKIRDSFTGATHPIFPSRTRSGRHGGGNTSDGRSATAAAGADDQHVTSDRTLLALLGAVGANPRQPSIESRRVDDAIAQQLALTVPPGVGRFLPDEPRPLREAQASHE